MALGAGDWQPTRLFPPQKTLNLDCLYRVVGSENCRAKFALSFEMVLRHTTSVSFQDSLKFSCGLEADSRT